jgi:hypothetical protein
MAEPKRVLDDNITTADLAGRSEVPRQAEGKPSLLRNERRAESESAATLGRSRVEEVIDPSERATAPSRVPIPLTRGDDVEVRTEATPAEDQSTPLFAQGEIENFRSRWSDIQTGFVDEPRQAVKDADNLVAALMQKLAEGFASEREGLERQWDRGAEISTEDLRVALRRYRSFFDRLLRV